MYFPWQWTLNHNKLSRQQKRITRVQLHVGNRQEKANAGNVTQKIHPPLKQSTLIHTQTHTYRKSYINSLKIHVRHTLNKDNKTKLIYFIMDVSLKMQCTSNDVYIASIQLTVYSWINYRALTLDMPIKLHLYVSSCFKLFQGRLI